MRFDLNEYLDFKQLIVPPMMKVLYILGFIGITIFAIASINANALIAVLIFIFGQIYFRFIMEILMVFFRINDTLKEINQRGKGL